MADKGKGKWWDEMWPIVTGCTPVSPACTNCYAARLASTRLKHNPHYKGLAVDGRWTGEVRLNHDILDKPLHWRKPRRIFVAGTGDLFHEDVPDDFIDKVYAVMALCPQHTFQVLTKRPERMAGYIHSRQPPDGDSVLVNDGPTPNLHYWEKTNRLRCGYWCAWPLPNVWHGTTVENQEQADKRIPHLLATPSALRFLSMEPLIADLNLRAKCPPEYRPYLRDDRIAWLIIGCESGPKRRPCKPEWVQSLIEAADATGILVFVKQLDINGKVSKNPKEWPEWARRREMPRKGQ